MSVPVDVCMLCGWRVFDDTGRYTLARHALAFAPYHPRPHMDTSITLPSALPAERTQMEKFILPYVLPLVSFIYNTFVTGNGWINVGRQSPSRLMAEAVKAQVERARGQSYPVPPDQNSTGTVTRRGEL